MEQQDRIVKICPQCEAQFDEELKFCPNDGAKLIVDQPIEQKLAEEGKILAGGDVKLVSDGSKSTEDDRKEEDRSIISGGKILAGGDVNISKTVQQNITNIRQDDTKKIMTCVVSGRQDVISEGALCHICGQWAHKSHFYPKHKECEKCHTEKELNIKCEYRNLFEESIIDDDKIDSDERSVLQAVAKDLGLSQNEVEQIESEVRKKRQSRLFAIRSPEENIRIKKASKLLLKSCQYKQAYTELENLTKSLKKDLEVSNLYVLAAIAHNPKVAIEVLDRDPKYSVDTPKKVFYECVPWKRWERMEKLLAS